MTATNKTKTMTKSERLEIANRIAAKYGCDIALSEGTHGTPCIVVERRWQQGEPNDSALVVKVRREIEAAGISTDGWLS